MPSLTHVIKNKWISSSKLLKGVGIAFVILLIFFLIRGCSASDAIRNCYIIGQDERWTSIDVMNKERELAAFNIELLTAIAHEEKMRLTLKPTAGNLLLGRLNNRELDGISSNLEPTMMNQLTYLFSEPYFPTGPVLIISAREKLKGWNENADKIVAVQAKSPAILNLEKDPTIHIKLYNNILRALADLDDQKIDGAVFPALPSYVYTNTFYEGKLKVATAPLNNEGLRLIALKDERGKELIESFNEGLQKIRENGVYQDLLTEWGFINFEKIDN
ncbi:MAG: amino acid ABC transporter substrate-binding protein [Candidatus Protochlamydia sp.]|nr:amino acid ABC transporter substrate-binding protein [Candidatus Protochlamydia sp.]